MTRANGYSVENGFDLHTVYGRTFIHIDKNVEECCAYYHRERLAGVRVNPARGYPFDSLEPLARFGRDIESLAISQPDRAFDLNPLYQMANIRSLHIGGPCSLDLTRFERLRSFSGQFDNALKLGEAPLESLSLRVVRGGRDIDELPLLPTLRTLSILESRQGGVRALSDRAPALTTLTLDDCRKLTSLQGLEALRALRILHADNCRRIEDHGLLAQCQNLESIRLNDCGSISSIQFISTLPKLKELRFVGSKVLDGDMSSLLNLKYVGFDRRKHYSHTPDQIDALLRPNGGAAVTRFGDPPNPFSSMA